MGTEKDRSAPTASRADAEDVADGIDADREAGFLIRSIMKRRRPRPFR
jgi:hypothetical protein